MGGLGKLLKWLDLFITHFEFMDAEGALTEECKIKYAITHFKDIAQTTWVGDWKVGKDMPIT